MQTSGLNIMRTMALIGAVVAPLLALPGAASAEPLRVAADVGYAPWAMRSASGDTSGFSIDVAEEIAKRIGRDGVEVIDVNFSAIFAGLFAERYDMIVAPMQITETRADELLFTEGYLTSGLALVAAESNDTIDSPEDLNGKILATNNGSQTDIWATANAEKYGFTVQRYDKDTDAMQAVVTGRADADIVNMFVAQHAAKNNKKLKVVARIYTDKDIAYAVRPVDVELRNTIEVAMECMKLDGTMHELHEKWFGEYPEPVNSIMKVYAGFGPVGFKGYDATFHVPDCK